MVLKAGDASIHAYDPHRRQIDCCSFQLQSERMATYSVQGCDKVMARWHMLAHINADAPIHLYEVA